MEILKFDGGKQSNKRNRLITAIAGAFFVAAVGSTFAANITINSTNTLEYGQGLTTAAACDDQITIIPTNHYVNSSGSSGTFYIDTITVTDSRTADASTGLGNCIGKTLKISAFNGTAGSAALFSCPVSVTGYSSGITGTAGAGCPTGTTIAAINSGNLKGFQMSFSNPATNPGVLAGNVYKITVESY